MKKTLILGLAAIALSACSYSEGDRAGIIVKFSKKGYVCKTWEGEMVLGGLKTITNTSTSSDGGISTSTSLGANVFLFSVTDETLVPAILAKLESGERVTLHYDQPMLPAFCSRGSDSLITGVK